MNSYEFDGEKILNQAIADVLNASAEPGELVNEQTSLERSILDNMDLSTLQFVPGGEDTAHVSLWCEFEGSSTVHFQMADLKSTAQKGGSGAGNVNGVELVVGESGAFRGSYFEFVLKTSGIGICLGRRLHAEGSHPNVLVSIGSLALHAGGGLEGQFMEVRRVLGLLGYIVKKDTLSRVDVCCDLVGVSIDELHQPFSVGNFICRATTAETIGTMEFRENVTRKVVTTFYIGKGLQCCIYDKRLESQRDPTKLQFFEDNLWGGDKTSDVTRVEFRMKREDLKKRGVTSVADWVRERASIMVYLSTEWLRFTEGHDDRHTERAVILDVWKQVQDICRNLFLGEVRPVRCVHPSAMAAEALARQALGCLTSALARLGYHTDDAFVLRSMLSKVFFELTKKWRIDQVVKKYVQKCEEFRANVPITL